MKSLTLLLSAILYASIATAQWSNTSNQFTNDLHMPVCTATGDQAKAMIIPSYPDGGHFVIWEDKRNGFNQPFQVYAQKYDASGSRLWAENGIAISGGTNNQQFTFSSNQDHRNRKSAASDKAGGLYITYTDDSTSNYVWKRICVQHLRSNGQKVFPNAGWIVAQTPPGQTYNFLAPQLIADNDGGFYLGYINKANNFNDYVNVYNFREEADTLRNFGGGTVNQNLVQKIEGNPCGGIRYDIVYPGTTVLDYNIWPDLQGNCSVVISMQGNIGSQGNMLCYNKVWKAKKDQTVNIAKVLADGSPDEEIIHYKKGDADVLWKARFNAFNRSCSNAPNVIYTWIDYIPTGQGFRLYERNELPYYSVKGVTIATGGNVNAELITANRSEYAGSTAAEPRVIGVGFTDEIFDAVPYPRASNDNPYLYENLIKPNGLDSLIFFRDDLLASGITDYDYSLAAGGSHAYLAALIQEKISDNAPNVRLQHLSVKADGPGRYKLSYETGNTTGDLIGKELNTGFGVTAIDYDFPLLTANATGNALLTINELGRYTRVSPIFNKTELAWGAMGRPIGSPQANGAFVSALTPHAFTNALDGTGLITWTDQRDLNAGQGQNIFMRHLDQLNVATYVPPGKKVQPLPPGSLLANPFVLTGASKHYSPIEAYDATTGTLSPVAEILDNYNLGSVPVGIYQHTGAIRTTNGRPYLDRNYTITPANNPNGGANINVRLFFTTAEFDALKTADASIIDPGSLSVIKQPNAGGIVPSSLITDGSEAEIFPVAWQSVDGGYYLEIIVSSFSNFFIRKSSSTLPLTWVNVKAEWMNAPNAKISWQVSEQVNVKDYIVQESSDGTMFTDKCRVIASDITHYDCIVSSSGSPAYFYRVQQRDIDGRYSYSKTVTLKQEVSPLSFYPNPAMDKLILTNTAGYKRAEIIDMGGTVVLRQQLTTTQQLDISQLKPGLYLLNAIGDGPSKIFRFVKH
ncbi:MAG: T9SS type A sorting domain-containing protein [Chitinophagaceae bacterium]